MLISKKWMRLGITTVIVLFSAGVPKVAAHHGFRGEYDASRPLYIQGTVQQVRWQSPHSTLIVELPKNLEVPPDFRQLSASKLSLNTQQRLTVSANLLGTRSRVEFPPVVSMVAPLRDRLQVGDSIQLVVLRNCQPPNHLRVLLARLTDGTTVARAKTANQVNGCPS